MRIYVRFLNATAIKYETTSQVPPADDKLSYSATCQTFSLTGTPSLNQYFGYTRVNDTYIIPGTPSVVFNFDPNIQVRHKTWCLIKWEF